MKLKAWETSAESATQAAQRFADDSGMPQTVYRDADSGGYWHTNPFATRLAKAELVVTAMPRGYFDNWRTEDV